MIIDTLKENKFFMQFGKFFIVGILNTGLDFAVLNFLMWMTQTYKGPSMVIFGTISFAVAVTNSYFLNKYWTFGDKSKEQVPQQFIKFLAVAVIGLVLSNSIIYFITTLVNPIFGLSPVLWANFAKAVATGVVLVWNFAGYKLFVFKK
ncbi:MAG: GtrA family protein [bacterium]|nr:GtrA family protein [bacterium]